MNAHIEHPHEVGTLVELTRDIPENNRMAGTKFTIEDYVSAEEAEDGIAFYWGSTSTDALNDIDAPADAVKVVSTRAQMDARTIPTRSEVLSAVGTNLLIDADRFEVTKTSIDYEGGKVECYGRTYDGLDFGFTITINPPFHNG